MGHFVEFQDVCKYYTMGEQRITAADHITFTIEQGEFTIIVGPSGAGKTTVLITLESGWETLYVREEKTDQDSARPSSGEGMVSERLLREESYVLVDGSGGRSALVRTRMEPVVRGVVVVCEGGDDPLTVTRILEAVTTALGVSSAKVCITKCA